MRFYVLFSAFIAAVSIGKCWPQDSGLTPIPDAETGEFTSQATMVDPATLGEVERRLLREYVSQFPISHATGKTQSRIKPPVYSGPSPWREGMHVAVMYTSVLDIINTNRILDECNKIETLSAEKTNVVRELCALRLKGRKEEFGNPLLKMEDGTISEKSRNQVRAREFQREIAFSKGMQSVLTAGQFSRIVSLYSRKLKHSSLHNPFVCELLGCSREQQAQLIACFDRELRWVAQRAIQDERDNTFNSKEGNEKHVFVQLDSYKVLSLSQLERYLKLCGRIERDGTLTSFLDDLSPDALEYLITS